MTRSRPPRCRATLTRGMSLPLDRHAVAPLSIKLRAEPLSRIALV
jgi:hypothetical protein